MTSSSDPFDPDPFAPDAVSAETAEFNERLEGVLAQLPPPQTIPPAVTRAARAEGKGLFPAGGPAEGSAWRDIPGAPGGPGRVRVSRAPGGAPRGAYQHIHGGGWTFNSADLSDVANQALARDAGVDVYSAAYRLAPENRWPAAAEDCEAAALWFVENVPGPLLIGGESAGAHLAAVTLLRLKARGLADRIAGAALTYGMYDLAMTPSMRRWGDRFLVLSTPIVAWFVDNLLGEGDRADPAVSPLNAELGGLPPALFTVGTADPLIDDTLFMAARWRAAGNRAELVIVPGGVHGFDAFDLAIAREHAARLAAFVTRVAGSG